MTIKTVFAGAGELLVKNLTGFYDSSIPEYLQSLQNIECGTGYLIKASDDGLSISKCGAK